MEAKATIKTRWAAWKLFLIGLAGWFISLVCVIVAALLWWPMAFSWDSEGLPIPAYCDIVFGIIGALGLIASILVMMASGIRAVWCYGKTLA